MCADTYAELRATRERNGLAERDSGSDSDGEDLVDCCLVPGGGDPQYAHLAVVCARSPLLQELALLEGREDGDDEPLLQLLVPDLSPRACALLLEFCYCDDVVERRALRRLRSAEVLRSERRGLRLG